MNSGEPQAAQRRLLPDLLELRRTAEKALAAVIQEAYGHCDSTRSVGDLVKAMGSSDVSKSQVSRLVVIKQLSEPGGELCASLRTEVNAFQVVPTANI